RPGGFIRLLEYVRPHGTFKRIVSMIWQPWISWAYGASFDREIEKHIPASGLEPVESRYVVEDLVKLISARVPATRVAAQHGSSPDLRRTRTCPAMTAHLSTVDRGQAQEPQR